jgi:antirestriction protein ArdC
MGYGSGLWATYKQWSELGAQVRKGEKATSVVFWKFSDVQTKTAGEDSEEGSERRIPFAREYWVFNAEQVSGFKTEAPEPGLSESEKIERAENFFSTLGAEIRHGGNRAFFSADADLIWMPNFSAFKNGTAYYSVLAHETTHWTGVAHRLNRELSGRFGSEAYAAEELIAELGAAFLSADLSLCTEPRTDHAAYIDSWLKALRNDKRAIFTASSKAQAAVDWMHSKQEEGRAAA